MNSLRQFIDKIKPNFEKGGKFEKLGSTFGAFETFAFVPNEVTKKGSHIRDAVDMKRTIIVVVLALIPALLFGMWNVGYQHSLSMGETAPICDTIWQNFWYGFLRVLPIITAKAVANATCHSGIVTGTISGISKPVAKKPSLTA